MSEEYRGYFIDAALVPGGFTVCVEGDEIFFDTIEEARAFIDSL